LTNSFTYRLSSLFFALLLIFQMQGPWLIFKIQQQAVRSEIKQQLKAGVPEDELVNLKIAKVWEEEPNDRFEREHSREFRFDGEWYDIMRSQDLGDTTLYVCIHDVKESRLFERLAELTLAEMSEPEQEENRLLILSNFISDYHFESEKLSLIDLNSNRLLYDQRSLDIRNYHPIICPPPNPVFFS
jgi:hypothetical protein